VSINGTTRFAVLLFIMEDPMPTDRPLRMIVEMFLRETGMPATTFGRLALNDPRFVLDLRLGREAGTRVRCRVEHFMNMERASRMQLGEAA
jgi:hypothetical protein